MANLTINNQEIINRFIENHGNKYDYSLMNYKRSDEKIIVICPKHGKFSIRPNSHWRGIGCKQCGIESKIQKTTKTIEKFILDAQKIHHDRYDYSKTIYFHSEDYVNINCKIHGEFKILASNHLAGWGCNECSKESKLPILINKFIQNANEIHNFKYDYSKVNYKVSYENINIICLKHGEFLQTPANHIQGKGCPKCGELLTIEKLTSNKEEFIEKAQIIHNNKYDYSKVKYINTSEKIVIICNEKNKDNSIHGEFLQTPGHHINNKNGCPKCSGKIGSTEEFIRKAIEVHGNKYEYHKVEYLHPLTPVWIHCTEVDKDGLVHGDFPQIPSSHLFGRGCPKCSLNGTSKQEEEVINYIKSLNQTIIERSKTILNDNYELDIYIPEKQLAIEYNGLYWHNEINKSNNKYHLNKTNICKQKGIQLIHIFEDEWIEKQEIVKSRLRNLLRLNQNKIFARKCIIKEVSIEDTRKFLEINHIQGFIGSIYSYGLYYQNELVSLMNFGNLRKNLGSSSNENEYELLRFCNKLNTTVIGSASKLFQHFIKNVKYSKIISYADIRWSKGKLYETLGFEYLRDSEVNYFYVIGQTRKNRFNFRKDILISKYGCSPEDTEHNFCFNQGWYRIYDCGTKVYEYKNKIIL